MEDSSDVSGPEGVDEGASSMARRALARHGHTLVTVRMRAEHDGLWAAMHRLEVALETALPSHVPAWKKRIAGDLRQIRDALEQHIASVEAAKGLFTEIDKSRPSLAHCMARICREHFELLAQTGQLVAYVEQCSRGADFQETRRRAAALLHGLRHHEERETDLLFENAYAEIGAAD
jgi:hypothetical protein